MRNFPLLTDQGELQGATLAHLDKRYITTATPRSFGGAGDGATDDTAALRAWLAAPGTFKQLPEGTWVLSADLKSDVDGLVLVGPGTIRATKPEGTPLTLSGAGVTVQGLRVDGTNNARYGIRATGENHTIEHCVFENFRATQSTARGIDSSTVGRVIIRDNVIRNVVAVGNTSAGDTNGMCRGIVLHSPDNKTAPAICTGNLVENIGGEESDAIAVLYSNAVSEDDPYEQGWTRIASNVIRNCGRRHIKIQGSDIWVDSNWCYNLPGYAQQNPSAVIDIVQGNRVRVTDNLVKEAGNTAPMSIAGPSSSLRITDIEISGNRFEEGDNSSPVVYVVNADRVSITRNTMLGGKHYVSGGSCADLVIAYNDCRAGDTTNPAFNFTSSGSGKVRFNTVPTGRAVGTATNIVFEGNA
ncbi:hypothetical protein [Kocuria rhizophila]|uniref:hypothetical protein n=1 Tax=Kocuria rhizophila TaxID=72000 RepID=UPI003D6E8365